MSVGSVDKIEENRRTDTVTRPIALSFAQMRSATNNYSIHDQESTGAGTRGDGVPHFFRQGDASPTPPLFWTETRAKVSLLLQLVTY